MPRTVTITDSTPGAVIHYSEEGLGHSTPDTVYTSPLVISDAEDVFAYATAPGFTQSNYSQADYMLEPAQPGFNPHAGTYQSALKVALFDTTPGSTIYYTLDGSSPGFASPVYTGPITISKTTTILACAGKTGWYLGPTSRGNLHHPDSHPGHNSAKPCFPVIPRRRRHRHANHHS